MCCGPPYVSPSGNAAGDDNTTCYASFRNFVAAHGIRNGIVIVGLLSSPRPKIPTCWSLPGFIFNQPPPFQTPTTNTRRWKKAQGELNWQPGRLAGRQCCQLLSQKGKFVRFVVCTSMCLCSVGVTRRHVMLWWRCHLTYSCNFNFGSCGNKNKIYTYANAFEAKI